MRIPKTDPIAAKLPTAAMAEPPADTADAPSSSRTPRMSWSPSKANVVTTRALTTNTATPAWANTASRSPRRTATIPAMPPSITYAASSRPAPLTAAARTAISAVRTIAAPPSRSTVTSIPMAASGSAYGSHMRPAVSLSARTAISSNRLSRSMTLLRCQNSRRNRQVQVSSRLITRIDSTTKPASRATSRPPLLSA